MDRATMMSIAAQIVSGMVANPTMPRVTSEDITGFLRTAYQGVAKAKEEIERGDPRWKE